MSCSIKKEQTNLDTHDISVRNQNYKESKYCAPDISVMFTHINLYFLTRL